MQRCGTVSRNGDARVIGGQHRPLVLLLGLVMSMEDGLDPAESLQDIRANDAVNAAVTR